MTSATFALLSGALTYGVPLALAIRELVVTRPARRGGGDEPPPEPRYPHAPKPLPACLLPPRAPGHDHVRIRVLEDA